MRRSGKDHLVELGKTLRKRRVVSDGGTEYAPSGAKVAGSSGDRIFTNGDRVSLVVNMDSRTLTFRRNDVPIPELSLGGLPDKCYIVATCDTDLKRRIRKIPGVPIMYLQQHRYTVERMPEAVVGSAPNR